MQGARAAVDLDGLSLEQRSEDAVRVLGEQGSTGASLNRMFANCESGELTLMIEAYRRAFAMIYQAPYEALGLAPRTSPVVYRLLALMSTA